MENILAKHWCILLGDPFLGSSLTQLPKVSYRRAKNIKSRIAPSKIRKVPLTPASHIPLIPLVGMYQCRKKLYLTCKFVDHGQKNFTVKDKTYTIKDFYNCSSEYVVYCLTCPCGLFYVGRTIRPLRQRFGEHRRFIEKGWDKHSVPLHFLKEHQKSTMGLRVWVIEAMPRGLPAAERFKRLCQQKAYWIYSLGTLSPGGLNEELETHSLL